MVKVSKHYSLGRSQASLEFVDIDIRDDTPVFIDPGSLLYSGTTLARRCASLLQSFFGHIMHLIQTGQHGEAQALLATLNEPNETRFGFTEGRSSGHGMGEGLAANLWDALSQSRAAASGLLADLEDTALFVEGIDRDIISDIVTNIIRGPLIDFTVTMAQRYAIPVRQGFAMEEWDGRAKRWVGRTADLPFADSRPLLLVPRTFVRRRRGTFSADRYYRHYVLPEIQQQHLNSNSNLVRVLKSGVVRPPFKKTLQALYPDVKSTNVDSTINHSALLDDYRQDAERNFTVIGHSDLAKATGSRPDWDRVLQDVLQVPVGNPSAHDYHMAVEALLTAVLYPALDFPVIEREINHGRKRIDISYTNIATSGFFYWMHAVHNEPCSYIPVECKNYGREVNNREFDQLIGRFSVQQGKVGLLCYRGFTDKNLAIQRCRDALLAGQGIMIPIDDADLEEIVAERKRSQDGLDLRWFFDRFQQITS